MKVGLIDVDGHNFPNLALMKISTYHKSLGDDVVWYEPLFDKPDIVYQSKVFTFTPDYPYMPPCEVIKGGSGYDLQNKLPEEIEKMCPDYSIYNNKLTAYGFLTRGCPNGCPFCIVWQKEGRRSVQVSELGDFWMYQKEIKLLDPNLLACKNKKELLNSLLDSKAYIDFTQGLDIRLMGEEEVDIISRMKIKMLHFAWDRPNQSEKIVKNLAYFKKLTGIDERKARVYVLVNYETPIEFDLERIYKIRELGFDPYVMVYDKPNASKTHKRIQRWVNNKYVWRSCARFEDYNP